MCLPQARFQCTTCSCLHGPTSPRRALETTPFQSQVFSLGVGNNDWIAAGYAHPFLLPFRGQHPVCAYFSAYARTLIHRTTAPPLSHHGSMENSELMVFNPMTKTPPIPCKKHRGPVLSLKFSHSVCAATLVLKKFSCLWARMCVLHDNRELTASARALLCAWYAGPLVCDYGQGRTSLRLELPRVPKHLRGMCCVARMLQACRAWCCPDVWLSKLKCDSAADDCCR